MIKNKVNNNKKREKTLKNPEKTPKKPRKNHEKTAENHRIQGCKMDSQKYEKNK